jgi:hypothetical protein
MHPPDTTREGADYYLPADIVIKIEDYCNFSEHDELALKNAGIKLASEPRAEDTSIESVLMASMTKELGVAKSLINEVDRIFEPEIADLNFEYDYIGNTPTVTVTVDSSDPMQRLQQQVVADAASFDFKTQHFRKLEVGRKARRLEQEQSNWQRTIMDGFWKRFNIVVAGALKASSIDMRVLGCSAVEYRQALDSSWANTAQNTSTLLSSVSQSTRTPRQLTKSEENIMDSTFILVKDEDHDS